MTVDELYSELILERFGPIPWREKPGRVVRREPKPKPKIAAGKPLVDQDTVVRRLVSSGLPDWVIADRVGCSEAMVVKIRNRRRRGAA